MPLIIRKNFYYKKMNLSDDLAKWSGYEVYLKNETHTIVCIILRRMFIPPLLDRSQDIFITFKISHQSQQEFDVTDKDLHAEVYVVANSITPNDIHNAFYANLIQVQVDALLYNSDVYGYFETALKIKPSYFDQLKMFFKSMLVILKEGDVVISSDVMDFLGEDTKVERNLEYLLNVILNRIPGVNLLDTHRSEQIKINRVLHRLSDYLLYCLDSGFLSEKFNVTDLIKGAIAINADGMPAMNDVLNFLLHLRSRDYSAGYRKDCLELLREEETPARAVAPGEAGGGEDAGADATPNGATASARTQIEQLLAGEDHSVSDFLLFHLHQCGYINQRCRYQHDSSYKHIIACILKHGVNMKIKKKILHKLLLFSNDYKKKYDSTLVSAIVYFLAKICEEKKKKKKKKLAVLILSVLINITSNNEETKTVLIRLDIHKTCNLLILSNDCEIVQKVCLLYINLSKSKWMCEGIVNSGILLHMMDFLFNMYAINLRERKEICINILCVIGQVCNYCKTYAHFLLSNHAELVSAAMYIYQATDKQLFEKGKLIYFFKQMLVNSYQMGEQICRQLSPLMIKEIYSSSEDKNFIYSSLSLFDAMCCYKVNCLHLEGMQIAPLLRFVKALNVVELYRRAERIEAALRKNKHLGGGP